MAGGAEIIAQGGNFGGWALYAKDGKSTSESKGSGKGVVVIKIPARPFLRPAFKAFSKDVQKRFLRRVARALGMGGL